MFSARMLAAAEPMIEKPFYLPAQQFAIALDAWAMQSGLRVVCYLDPMAPPNASAVIGNFTPEEALRRLLKGTGVVFSIKNGTASIWYEKKPKSRTRERPRSPSGEDLMISTELDGVVVTTGTKIPGGRPVGSPVLRLSKTDLSRFGHSTIDQDLQGLPEFTRGGVSGDSPDWRLGLNPRSSGNTTFASAANLRALGSAATLTLLNDRRMASSGQGIADLSVIPSAAVKEVQVLKDGASAIYGTDAVGGVVNVILLEEPDQDETKARYAATTRAARQEVSASQTLGAKGERASIVGVASYMGQTPLTVDERSRTSDVAPPENIYPSNKLLSLYLAGRYEPGDAWTLRAQALQTRVERHALGFWRDGHFAFPISIDRTHGALSADYKGDEGWKVVITALGSREATDSSFLAYPRGSAAWDPGHSQQQHLTQSLWAVSVDANKVIDLFPSVDLELAIGAEHREEAYTRRLRSTMQPTEDVTGEVDSAYAELQVPLVTRGDELERTDVLRLSFAGRVDSYSDFGSRRNPKLAIAWTPIVGFEVRSTWGKSLRTPSIGQELSSAARGTESSVGIYSFTRAEGEGRQPGALLSGSRPLRPETARHWTAGFLVQPPTLKGWTFEASYFDIDYRNRIVAPPLNPEVLRNPDLQGFVRTYATSAELQAALEREAGREVDYEDLTGTEHEGGEFGQRPWQDTVTVYDVRLLNASKLRTKGVDMSVRYAIGDLQTRQLQLGLAATLTTQLETVFAPGARAVDLVGTTGYPPRWRGLATAALLREAGWGAAVAVRVNDSFMDTTSVVPNRVRSSLTVDAQVSYSFSSPAFRGLTLSLSGSNLFDEAAPYITGSESNRWAHYDTANSDLLGPMISLEVSKRW